VISTAHGGTISNGDEVYLWHQSLGRFLWADSSSSYAFGGCPRSAAERANAPCANEPFEIYSHANSGPIVVGDTVYLKHVATGKWYWCGDSSQNCYPAAACPGDPTNRAAQSCSGERFVLYAEPGQLSPPSPPPAPPVVMSGDLVYLRFENINKWFACWSTTSSPCAAQASCPGTNGVGTPRGSGFTGCAGERFQLYASHDGRRPQDSSHRRNCALQSSSGSGALAASRAPRMCPPPSICASRMHAPVHLCVLHARRPSVRLACTLPVRRRSLEWRHGVLVARESQQMVLVGWKHFEGVGGLPRRRVETQRRELHG